MHVNDIEPGTYVAMKVLNSDELIAFCASQGLVVTKPDELHVTIAYSRKHFDFYPAMVERTIKIQPGCSCFESLNGCLVLMLDSVELQCEFARTREAGAQYDYDQYQPHVTIEYDCGDVDISYLENPNFCICLGQEYVEDLDPDWVKNQ